MTSLAFVGSAALCAIICNSAFRVAFEWEPNYFYLYDYSGTPLKFLYTALPTSTYGWFSINWLYTLTLLVVFVGVFIGLFITAAILVEKLNKKLEKYIEELSRIENIIDTIDDPQIRIIARLRLIDNLNWEDIGRKVFLDRTVCYRKLKKCLGEIYGKKAI